MTSTTTPDFASRVRRGAELLDRVRPGWERELDLERLAVRDCHQCVLGQLFGEYKDGLRMLGKWSSELWDSRVPFGFALRLGERPYFPALTDAWRALVRERLGREGQS